MVFNCAILKHLISAIGCIFTQRGVKRKMACNMAKSHHNSRAILDPTNKCIFFYLKKPCISISACANQAKVMSYVLIFRIFKRKL